DGSGCLQLDDGIVEGEVVSVESLESFLQGRLHLVASRHIAAHREGATALLRDQSRSFFVCLLTVVGHCDARACACKGQCRRATNSAASSGDECHLTFKVESVVHNSSFARD